MKHFLTLLLFSFIFISCSSDNDELIKEVSVKINFTQNWDGTTIQKSNLSTTEYTNKLGTKLSVDRLRYLISNITLTNGADKKTILTETRNNEQKTYKLVDLSKDESLIFNSSEKISEGVYNLSMTFGFNNDDNKDGIHKDLNNDFDVPGMLGGGYHYMQMDGKYLNSSNVQSNFNYHAIRAVDKTDPNNLKFEDTFFTINLGTLSIKNNATIEVKMNVAGWFKNPNDWDLNTLNSMLMPNFEAQKLMSANGKTGVFSLGTISQ